MAFSLDALPYEVLFQIGIHLDLTSLSRYCQISLVFAAVSLDAVFWRHKIRHEFPGYDLTNIPNQLSRRYYVQCRVQAMMDQAEQLRNDGYQTDPLYQTLNQRVEILHGEINQLHESELLNQLTSHRRVKRRRRNHEIESRSQELSQISIQMTTIREEYENRATDLETKASNMIRRFTVGPQIPGLDTTYYPIKTLPEFIETLASHLNPDHDTATDLQTYLIHEGYFRHLTVRPGNLLGISPVIGSTRQLPIFLLYIYAEGSVKRYQVIDTRLSTSHYPSALLAELDKYGWDSSDIETWYRLPFKLNPT
jgi:hypothetical protein